MADQKAIEAEVAALGGLTLSALRERWRELFGGPAPKSLRKAFLVKACAHQIQVRAHGGLSGRTKRRLRRIAEAISAGKSVAIAPSRRIKPGTRLVRAWGGAVHTVTVVAGGFEYAGARHSSLSAIAKTITGSNWNGPAFFGLEGAAGGAQGADKPRTRSQDGGDGGPVACTGADAAGARLKEMEVCENV